MQVRAKRTGWDGLVRRREGTVFDWPADRRIATWVEPVDPNHPDSKRALVDLEKERQRAEHARLQREAFGGNVGAMQAQLAESQRLLQAAHAEREASQKAGEDITRELQATRDELARVSAQLAELQKGGSSSKHGK